MTTILRLAAVWLLLAGGCTAACAHAALVGSDPADGAVLAAPPTEFVLTFTEPVSPTALQLAGADGKATVPGRSRLANNVLTIDAPPDLAGGSYALSWRVVSQDGHPVGGSVLFSIGAPGARMAGFDRNVADSALRAPTLMVRFIIYAGLFAGIGGLFFTAFIAVPPPPARAVQTAALTLALAALPVSVGLQGLDALGGAPGDIGQAGVWRAAIATTYAWSAAIAACAATVALAGLSGAGLRRRLLSLASLAALGVALASTGHGGSAPPQWLTRPAVFVHGIGIAIWIGALLPLALLVGRRAPAAREALQRFSRLIPLVIAPVILAGAILAVIQVDSPAAMWSTAYGRVLTAKLLLLSALLALAGFNRWRLTAPAAAGDPAGQRGLVRSIAAEIVLVLAILAVVALWRFTPPPRSLVAATGAPAIAQVHGAGAAGEIVFEPGRAGPLTVAISLYGSGGDALEAKEVTLTIANAAAGIEPIRRTAVPAGPGNWRIDGLVIPASGEWAVEVVILITDFDLLRAEAVVTLG